MKYLTTLNYLLKQNGNTELLKKTDEVYAYFKDEDSIPASCFTSLLHPPYQLEVKNFSEIGGSEYFLFAAGIAACTDKNKQICILDDCQPKTIDLEFSGTKCQLIYIRSLSKVSGTAESKKNKKEDSKLSKENVFEKVSSQEPVPNTAEQHQEPFDILENGNTSGMTTGKEPSPEPIKESVSDPENTETHTVMGFTLDETQDTEQVSEFNSLIPDNCIPETMAKDEFAEILLQVMQDALVDADVELLLTNAIGSSAVEITSTLKETGVFNTLKEMAFELE